MTGPKWRTIAETIAASIRSGEIRIGDQVLPARDLGTLHGVDANTARVATSYLRDLGVLRTVSGSGTYVADLPPDVLPEPRRLSPLERRVNARIDELASRVDALEQERS